VGPRLTAATPDLLIDAQALLSESPVWDDRREVLFWVDVPRGAIHSWNPVGLKHSVVDVSDLLGAIALDERGNCLAATRDRVLRVDLDSQHSTLLEALDVGELCRLNDGKCDPAGRFWVGSMALDETEPLGRLYRVDGPGAHYIAEEGIVISNGLDWNPQSDIMYYIDSPLHRIDIFDFEVATGTIANRRAFIDTRDVPGEPDGMTVDAEGCLWVAFWGGARVRSYSPEGHLISEMTLPVANVTNCAFGGRSLDELYITTAASDSTSDTPLEAHAGAVFVVRPGAIGRPPSRFRSQATIDPMTPLVW
jgi:sugar lactone lactonase YvrE